jgi:hypothetical protein
MKTDQPGRLLPLALSLAKAETLETLHDKTGLPLSWLSKFRRAEIKNPSVNRVEKIIVALRGRELV